MTDKIAEEIAEYLRYRLGNFEYFTNLTKIKYAMRALSDLGYEVVKVSDPKDPPEWPKEFDRPLEKSFSMSSYIDYYNQE